METNGQPETEVERLDALLLEVEKLRAQAAGNPTYGFDEPWDIFMRRMRLLPAQSYGARIQNRLARAYGWERVPAALDRGDVVGAQGRHFEIKVSVLTPSKREAHFVQIRPHQNVEGYHLFVVECDYSLVHMYVPSKAMKAEVKRHGTSSHGTQTAVRNNDSKELSIRFSWDGGIAKKWQTRYGQVAVSAL